MPSMYFNNYFPDLKKLFSDLDRLGTPIGMLIYLILDNYL